MGVMRALRGTPGISRAAEFSTLCSLSSKMFAGQMAEYSALCIQSGDVVYMTLHGENTVDVNTNNFHIFCRRNCLIADLNLNATQQLP